jgi:PAS domain S-box-containing protein
MNMQSEVNAAGEADAFVKTLSAEKTGEYAPERHDPPALSLDERGMILDCSKAFEKLFGFRRSELVWRHVSTLFTQLTGVELVQAGQVNPFLNYLCRCGQLYQAQNRQGDTFSSNLSFVRLEYGGRRFLRLVVRASGHAYS